MKFLIDECLSPHLVATANGAGYEAQPVARIGRAGWMDWNVTTYASEGDFILVTNNASDFRKLYIGQSLHAGLIILIPSVSRAHQQALFLEALHALKTMGEPVNKLIEVDLESDEVTLCIYDFPPSST